MSEIEFHAVAKTGEIDEDEYLRRPAGPSQR